MIFVTAGTQLPFDRLLRMMDEIAPQLGGEEIVAQACPDAYTPEHFTIEKFISPDRFEKLMDSASVVVAHAGIGTIISSMKRRKPLVVVPRIGGLGEHRNDHQTATARYLAADAAVAVANDREELLKLIREAKVPNELSAGPSPGLVKAVCDFIGV